MAEKFIARAHHAYTKAKPDEIDLSPGDVIRVTNNEHDSWWVGHNESTKERGWFPSNFVSKVESKPKAKTKRCVRCVKQFVVDEEDENYQDLIPLEVGDIIEVGKELEGWYMGTVHGRKGLFPASHVEEVSSSAAAAAAARDSRDRTPPVHRPLPVPPGASGAMSPPPPPLPPTSLSRQSTATGAPQAPPPALPQRQPPLPPRASTDISRGSDKRHSFALGGDDGGDDGSGGKKDKQKSGHRISRLFGTKKHKNKDAAESSDAAAYATSPQADEQRVLDDDIHDEVHEEEDEDVEEEDHNIISPAPPSRPLPQPAALSPPASARPALPPIPSMSLAKPPPVPSAAAPPVPAAAIPPLPAAPAPQRPASPRPISESSAKPPSIAAIADADAGADRDDGPIDEDANEESEAVAEPIDDSESTKPRGAKLAKIIEDYEAQQPEELNLMSGDVVTIISRGTEDDPRWKGEYHGKKGYFPAHVVDAIEESANMDEEEAEPGARPKGFKLAAYGVQQGGIGSIFAGGGLPSLRKAAPPPRKADDDEGGAAVPAPAPAMAPVIPKLRSVQRPAAAPKDEQKDEQVNFLAQLNRVPRKQTPSIHNEDSAASPISATPAAAPPLPLSRRSTAASIGGDSVARPAVADVVAPMAAADNDNEEEDEEGAEAVVEETADELPLARVPDLPAADIADAEVPEEEAQEEAELQADEVDAEEQLGADEDLETSSRTSSLDPVKSPALAGVKRLVRRAPRQKPTAEGLKKQSEESQSQSLHTALKKDKDLAPEPEAEPVRAAPPVLPEKPKGLARHGQFSGPQLPTGGFKASGRVGSAMASRLAALQARASGGGADEDATEDNSAPQPPPPPPVAASSRAAPAPLRSPPLEAVPSLQASKKPASFGTSNISPEWQRQIEDEQARLRGDVDAAKRANDHVDQLASRLAASERENQTHRQTISALERQMESLAAQLSSLQSNLSGVQRSVASLESSKGVTANEVTTILRDELTAATQPLHDQSKELRAETKVLHKNIVDLRAYVDELVVEEEQ
ncbi:hypothetical protein IWW47_001634 [Coemansia sp. RSA 2052]|nr:hypothetical protein IWW47_001634 [Coemansia sp. RSA 2052]